MNIKHNVSWIAALNDLTISDYIVTKILGYNKNYNSTNIMSVWSQLDINQIHSIEVRYIDYLGEQKIMSLPSFKQKLKPTTYSRNDFIEINSTTFGTTKEDLLESLYNRIIIE